MMALSSLSEENGKGKGLEVEIVSVNNITPAVPTPDHSKLYRFSLLDQTQPNMYMPCVFFYVNDEHQQGCKLTDHGELISKRRQVLKKSLSETLTQFYPLAGKLFADDRIIDCNDEGVYYVEARVQDHLLDFIKNPNNKFIHQLLPFDPSSIELRSHSTHVTMIQVTVFGCGGFAIGIYISHKIVDGFSYATFMKAWAATARGCSHLVCPSYISSSIFAPITIQRPKAGEKGDDYHTQLQQGKTTVTRRFVFSASSLMILKTQASAPSRVMAVISLICKCALTAKLIRLSSTNKPKSYFLALTVNLRPRSSPPLSPYAFGNIYWSSIAEYKAHGSKKVELGSVMALVKNASDRMDGKFIEAMKGEGRLQHIGEHMKGLAEIYVQHFADFIVISSLCNSGMYEVDFGWGKPLWVCFGPADTESPEVENLMYLMDTRSGDGIEAWVTLPEKDMAVLEAATELLQFASFNPSPLP